VSPGGFDDRPSRTGTAGEFASSSEVLVLAAFVECTHSERGHRRMHPGGPSVAIPWDDPRLADRPRTPPVRSLSVTSMVAEAVLRRPRDAWSNQLPESPYSLGSGHLRGISGVSRWNALFIARNPTPLIWGCAVSESPTETSSGNCPVFVRKLVRDNCSLFVRPIFCVSGVGGGESLVGSTLPDAAHRTLTTQAAAERSRPTASSIAQWTARPNARPTD
jgi:hypothetical protein